MTPPRNATSPSGSWATVALVGLVAGITGTVLPIPYLSTFGFLVAAIALIIWLGKGPKRHLPLAKPLKIVVLMLLIGYFIWSILIELVLAVVLRGTSRFGCGWTLQSAVRPRAALTPRSDPVTLPGCRSSILREFVQARSTW